MVNEAFFNRHTEAVARDLLGCLLIHEGPQGPAGGIIVESEAYLGTNDPGSHAYNGRNNRNDALFGPAGTAYVYFIYGMHYCLNVVTGRGEAVLIRALEPIEGTELMKRRRNKTDETLLCRGPACVTQALDIGPALNRSSLINGPIKITRSQTGPTKIAASGRIGISKGQDLKLRFFIPDNRFVSAPGSRRTKIKTK